MNLQHLKYAVEVEKTGSITQAAENLYMGQPNLSKAIKELAVSYTHLLPGLYAAGIYSRSRHCQKLHHAGISGTGAD